MQVSELVCDQDTPVIDSNRSSLFRSLSTNLDELRQLDDVIRVEYGRVSVGVLLAVETKAVSGACSVRAAVRRC